MNASPPGDRFDLAVLLDEQTLVLLGRCAASLPERAAVRLADNPAEGAFRALCWTSEDGVRRALAVIRAEGLALVRPSDMTLSVEGGETRPLPPVARVELSPATVLQSLVAAAPGALAAAYDFLLGVLLDPDLGTPGARLRRFVHAFMREISEQGGFVEIFGRPECGGLFVQGWSIHLSAGPAELWIETDELDRFPAIIGHFHRPDLLDQARGMVGFMLSVRDIDPAAVKRIYFRSPGGYHHLTNVDHPTRLEAAAATRHVAEMLPRIEAPVDTRRAFKRICRPRFEGQETVSALTRPVRAAIDCAMRVDGSGVFVTGWMLDPARLVSRVLLKSTRGVYERIDTVWSRLHRPDVSSGFGADALIGPKLRPGDHGHGFVVFVPLEANRAASEDERFYVEVVIEDEEAGFLPLAWTQPGATTVIRDMIAGLELDDPAAEGLIARHLAPVMIGALTPPATAVPPLASIEFGPVRDAAVSIVLPVSTLSGDVEVSLARLAGDPDMARAEILIVAPHMGAERLLGRFRRMVEFFRLGGRLLLTAEALGRHEALDLGVRQASAEHVLFLGLNVLPKESGWVRRLGRELAGGSRVAAVSPTLVYEDLSIRYAGRDPALADGAARFQGYSRHWLERQSTTPVGGITSECCLMPRRLFLNVGGFGRDLVGPTYKDDDLSLRLRAAGAQCLWAPGVELYALDDETADLVNDKWMRACRLVDRARFSGKWRQTDEQGVVVQ
jgi:hypothetical protein